MFQLRTGQQARGQLGDKNLLEKKKKKNLLEARGLLLVEALRERKQKSSVRDGKGHFITNTWTSQVPKGRSCREHDPRAYALSPSVCVCMLSKTEVIEEIWLFSPAHFLLRIQNQDCVNWYWGVSFEVRKKPMILFFLLNIVFDCFISLLPSSPDIIGSPNLISPLNERISRGWEWILGKSIWGNPEMSQYSSLPTTIIFPVVILVIYLSNAKLSCQDTLYWVQWPWVPHTLGWLASSLPGWSRASCWSPCCLF